MRAFLTAVAGVLLLGVITGAARSQTDQRPAFVVIVNTASPASRLDRRFVREAFLKKVVRWPDDRAIRPVDLDERAPVRRAFSDQVLNQSVEAVKSYWQQLIFSGRGVPPPELDNDAAVVDYVSRHAEAIGYVSGAADLAAVKPVVLD